MKRSKHISQRALLSHMIALCTLFALRGVGEEESADIRPLRLSPPQPESRNRFGVSARFGLNISASFKNLGSFSSQPFPPLPPLRTPDGDPYNYDNGYVYPDSGTPNTGLTHYWGYQGFTHTGGSQLTGDGTILMQRAASRGSSPGFNAENGEEDILPGVELTYNRELGRNRSLRWGLEAAINYMNVSVHDGQPLFGRATVSTDVTTDAYPLVEGTIIPPAPYAHAKDGPGVVIGATPQSSSQTSLAGNAVPEIVTGSRRLDADVFGFRFGPYLEIPVSEKFSVAFSGGVSLAEIRSDFRFNEKIQAGSVLLSTAGSGSHSDFLAGGYVEGSASYALTKSAGLFAGVQFQDLGQYSHKLQRKEALLDLSKSVFVTLGLTYSF